jgi:hypothetical protein
MAHIVSIEWNVEDFRRLISEEKLPPAKTIDVVDFEIAPSSETREGLPDAEAGLPKANDLHDPLFVDEAAAADPKDESTPEANDAALEIVDHEVVDGGPGKSLDQIANPFVVAGATAAFVVAERITSEERLETGTPQATEQPATLEASETPNNVLLDATPSTVIPDGKVTPKSSPLPMGAEGLGTPVGRPTHETTNMLYSGVEFSMVRCVAGGRWKWSVLVGQPAMLRMGEATSEQQAELNVRNIIDRANAIEETLQRLKRGDRGDA